MPSNKSRFVTACQQLLTLGLVVAALTPAASIVSLDVVQTEPLAPGTALSAYARTTTLKSVVPAGVVDPTVTEVALTPPSTTRGKVAVGALPQARVVAGRGGGSELTSLPQPVRGYGAVGVTWQHGVTLGDDEITVQVRTATASTWTKWMGVQYDADHGPDPESDEAQHSRPGTDALLVGDVDDVQVRVTTPKGSAPPDLRLAVIDPGEPTATRVEAPAIDTATVDEGAATATASTATDATAADATSTQTAPAEGALSLEAATYTPKPVIYSRAQWGADERMRDKGSLRYFEVHAGFVHHTVNANSYTQAEVPGLLRSIYAYHTQSRGWSDIGYNYLVDRFGRIWEGRYGGVDRPVVGAHTLNYNDYAFAMSAIGNYDIAKPSAATVQAYGALFAWKLSLHGVDASSTSQRVGSTTFPAINGHRDAAATACPGKYLYARIPRIRQLAANAQQGWTGRELESDLVSTPHPDLVVRRTSDQKAYLIPTGGLTAFEPARTAATVSGADLAVASPDLTGDGKGDLLVRSAGGSAGVRPGDGLGAFGAVVKTSDIFAGRDLVTPLGDTDKDGENDVVARNPATGRLEVYVGGGSGGFVRTALTTGWSGYDKLAAAGDVNGDGDPDLIARETETGKMWLVPGAAGAAFGPRVALRGVWKQYDTIIGIGDYSADRVPDLYVRRADNKLGYVLPGRGSGRFGHPLGPILSTRGDSAVTAAQVTGSGAPDLIGRRGGTLYTYENTGGFDTGRAIATNVDLSQSNRLLNAGDWNRDGFGDLITRAKSTGTLELRLGNGKGSFAAARRLATGFGAVGLLAAVGDMTGDGWPDLMGQPKGGDMRLYPGRGLNGLGGSYVASTRVAATRQIPIGRFDADGAPDLLFRRGATLTLDPSNGPGGLTGPRALKIDLTPYDWVIGISDVGLVGHGDLVVREKATGYLFLIPAGTTGFGARRFLGEGMGAFDLAG